MTITFSLTIRMVFASITSVLMLFLVNMTNSLPLLKIRIHSWYSYRLVYKKAFDTLDLNILISKFRAF